MAQGIEGVLNAIDNEIRKLHSKLPPLFANIMTDISYIEEVFMHKQGELRNLPRIAAKVKELKQLVDNS